MGAGGQSIIHVAMERKVGNERWRKCFLKCQQKETKKRRKGSKNGKMNDVKIRANKGRKERGEVEKKRKGEKGNKQGRKMKK